MDHLRPCSQPVRHGWSILSTGQQGVQPPTGNECHEEKKFVPWNCDCDLTDLLSVEGDLRHDVIDVVLDHLSDLDQAVSIAVSSGESIEHCKREHANTRKSEPNSGL